MTSSTASQSTFALRSTSAFRGTAARSSVRTAARLPPYLPNGVRTASQMKARAMFLGSESNDRQRRIDQRHARERGELLEGEPFRALEHDESSSRDIQHCQVGKNAVDATDARQRVGAARDDLRFALLGEMLHHHVDA